MHTNINVVIPAYKPDEKLIDIFKRLSDQTLPVGKIIVMNTLAGEKTAEDAVNNAVGGSDGSDNYGEVFELADRYGYEIDTGWISVYNITKDQFDHGKTRNEGASNISDDCDFVIFMTQDAVPYNSMLIEELVKPFENEKIGASYARQMPSEKSSLAEKFTRGFNYPDCDSIKTEADIERIGIKAFFCSNVCACYRRKVFDELGRFVNEAIFNEDMVYANKLIKSGYAIAYASKAMVIHTHEYSGMQQYRRNFDLAVSQKMNPQAFEGISSESEGVKYVKAAFVYFAKKGRPLKIIPFGMNCVYKYMGYRKGKKYETLTKEQILKATSNPGFFKNK